MESKNARSKIDLKKAEATLHIVENISKEAAAVKKVVLLETLKLTADIDSAAKLAAATPETLKSCIEESVFKFHDTLYKKIFSETDEKDKWTDEELAIFNANPETEDEEEFIKKFQNEFDRPEWQPYKKYMDRIFVFLNLHDPSKLLKEIQATQGLAQGEFWPVFTLPKTLFLKKEFSLNFGATERIRKDFPALLAKKLTNGKTLAQQLDEVDKWFSNLRGKDLGLWIKLFAYVQEVKEHAEKHDETVNFAPVKDRPGCYRFHVKRNKAFFNFFIRPDKKSGQITTKAKASFLMWLSENQKEIFFPIVIRGQLWAGPVRIYKYIESISGDDLIFEVDTNILESEFRDYISIPLEELDATADLWEEAASRFSKYKKFTPSYFSDMPMKLLIALKNIYNPAGDFETVKGFKGNVQWLHKDTLDQRMGGLTDRIQKHLESRGAIRTGKTSQAILNVKREILETLFDIAQERKWIFSCKYEKETYRFSLNVGFFAPQRTAQRLSLLKNGGGGS
jgi:hypothetical protein